MIPRKGLFVRVVEDDDTLAGIAQLVRRVSGTDETEHWLVKFVENGVVGGMSQRIRIQRPFQAWPTIEEAML